MRPILVTTILLFSGTALAHPGHGMPGLSHAHEWLDVFFGDTAPIICGAIALGLGCWAVARLRRRAKK